MLPTTILVDDHGDPLPPLATTVTATAEMGTVFGTVKDDVTGAAIAGAKVTVGAAEATTDLAGSFKLTAPTGHAVLTVSAAEHVTIVRSIGVFDADFPTALRLQPQGAAESVGASAHAIADVTGTRSLTFQDGSFASPTPVRATFITSRAAFPGDLLFTAPSGASVYIRETLDVDLPAEPAVPAIVKLPIPVGADPTKLRLYHLDPATGHWVDPISADSTSGGSVTFHVAHFSDGGLGDESGNVKGAVESAEGTDVQCTPGPCSDLMTVTGVTQVTGKKLFITVIDDLGNRQRISAQNVTVTLTPSTPTTPPTTTIDSTGDKSSYRDLYSSPPAPTPAPGQPRPPLKHMVRSRAVVMGVRGTVTSLAEDACGSGTNVRNTVTAAVQAGTVELSVGGQGMTLGTRQKTTACDGCKSTNDIACCWGGGTGGYAATCPSAPDHTYPLDVSWRCDDGKDYSITGTLTFSCRTGITCDTMCVGVPNPKSGPNCGDPAMCDFPEPTKDMTGFPPCSDDVECPDALPKCSPAGFCARM